MKVYPQIFLFISFLLLSVSGYAQPDPCTDPDVYCPVDGGLLALLAAGLFVGVKKARQKNKPENETVME